MWTSTHGCPASKYRLKNIFVFTTAIRKCTFEILSYLYQRPICFYTSMLQNVTFLYFILCKLTDILLSNVRGNQMVHTKEKNLLLEHVSPFYHVCRNKLDNNIIKFKISTTVSLAANGCRYKATSRSQTSPGSPA